MKYIGLDLHTDNFTACFISNGKPRFEQYTLNAEGVENFKSNITRKDKVAVECVSNAPYLKNKINSYVKSVDIVATGEFAVISKSFKKTDKNDAFALATYLSKGLLPTVRIRPKEYIRLRSLIDTRARLIEFKTELNAKVASIAIQYGYKIPKNKLTYLSNYQNFIFSKEWDEETLFELKFLYDQVSDLKNRVQILEKEIKLRAESLKGYENLRSIPGLGLINTAILLSVIVDIDDFDSGKKLCSYFGIVPKVRSSSGQNPSCRISKRGSKVGRAALIQATWVAIRHSPHLKKFYERLKQKKALNAL